MPTAIWSGAVSFGLVSIPVRLYPATEDKDVHFHLLHRDDSSRIKEHYYCPSCDQLVEWRDLVRGYEVSKGRYVAMTDDDFAAVPQGTQHSIGIAQFVKRDKIDPIFYERSYYLEPEELGIKPFALLLRTLQGKDVVAVARFTLRHKERTCVLRPYQNTLALHVLFAQDEVRPAELQSRRQGESVDKEMLALAKSYIEALSTDFLPEQHVDAYREAILTLIDEKAASLETKAATSPVQDGLPDLMAALQKAVTDVQQKKDRAATSRKRPKAGSHI